MYKEVDTSKIRGQMAEHNDSVKILSDYLGIAPVTLTEKLYKRVDFKTSEIIAIANRYQKPIDFFLARCDNK